MFIPQKHANLLMGCIVRLKNEAETGKNYKITTDFGISRLLIVLILLTCYHITDLVRIFVAVLTKFAPCDLRISNTNVALEMLPIERCKNMTSYERILRQLR